jgi:hypothetical protein
MCGTLLTQGLIDAIKLRPGKSRYDILLRGDLDGIRALSADVMKSAALSRDGLLQCFGCGGSQPT